MVMNDLKTLELLVGVKAEQSLRDAVRTAVESQPELDELELVPVGRKDWVAGIRAGTSLLMGDFDSRGLHVLTLLLKLESRQRIRRENVRLYVVPPPVPIFKDPPTSSEDDMSPFSGERASFEEKVDPEPETVGLGGPATCPVCNREVHSFNLQHDTRGKIVGCFICGGDPGFYKG